jgi:hypothetical protein
VQSGEWEGRLGLTARRVDNAARRCLSGLLRGKQACRSADPALTHQENGVVLVTGRSDRSRQHSEWRLAADQAFHRHVLSPRQAPLTLFTLTVGRPVHSGLQSRDGKPASSMQSGERPKGPHSSPGKHLRVRQEGRELTA